MEMPRKVMTDDSHEVGFCHTQFCWDSSYPRQRHCAFIILVMAAVNLSNLGDRVLTCAALTVVFASWTVFTIASLVLATTPVDELPLDELMARGDSHPLLRRVPKLSYRQTVSSKRAAATALLVPAQLVAYYIMWSYTITGA